MSARDGQLNAYVLFRKGSYSQVGYRDGRFHRKPCDARSQEWAIQDNCPFHKRLLLQAMARHVFFDLEALSCSVMVSQGRAILSNSSV
jgi:hypothetical protein